MDTTQVKDKAERKKLKRGARKKAETAKPLAKRTYARGSQKRKMKKMARGQAKR